MMNTKKFENAEKVSWGLPWSTMNVKQWGTTGGFLTRK